MLNLKKRFNSAHLYIYIAFAFLLALLLLAASVLGENHGLEDKAESILLENTIQKRYSSKSCNNYFFVDYADSNDITEYNCEDLKVMLPVLFKIALNLNGKNDEELVYDFERKRFWVPYLSNSVMKIDLIVSSSKSSVKPIILNDFFHFERKGFAWHLKGIRINNKLHEDFLKLMQVDKLIKINATQFNVTLQAEEPISIDELSLKERLLLKVKMEKFAASL